LTLLLAAFALGAAVARDRALAWDPPVAGAIQDPRSAALDQLAWIVSRIGDVWPALVIVLGVAVFLVARGRVDLAALLVAAASLRVLSTPLKALFGSPRPPSDALAILEPTDGYGYPSGHALGAALLCGAIAAIAPDVIHNPTAARAAQMAAVAAIALVALSRVRLGVHWPSDVVGGVLFGLGLVCLLVATLRSWRARTLKM
jgi:undecaprenyl-diphosphatase